MKILAIADISIWEILDELKKRKITLNYRIEDAEKEMENIVKKYQN